MLLAYVDESYTDHFFFLGALVVTSGDQICFIEEGLDALIEEFRESGAADLPDDVELHGYEMFQGADGWSSVPVRVRIAMYRRALRIVRESGAKVYLRGMDCERQRERYATPWPPHEVVLDFVLESMQARAARDDDYVLVVADEVHTSERHRTNFRFAKRRGTFGNYKSSKLARIVDTIHFAPSHHSRMLQAVDLATYLHRRRKTHPETDQRAHVATESVWSEIEPAVEVNLLWRP